MNIYSVTVKDTRTGEEVVCVPTSVFKEPVWYNVTNEVWFEKCPNGSNGSKGPREDDVVVHEGVTIARLVCGGRYRARVVMGNLLIERRKE